MFEAENVSKVCYEKKRNDAGGQRQVTELSLYTSKGMSSKVIWRQPCVFRKGDLAILEQQHGGNCASSSILIMIDGTTFIIICPDNLYSSQIYETVVRDDS